MEKNCVNCGKASCGLVGCGNEAGVNENDGCWQPQLVTWDCWHMGFWGTAFITTTNRLYFGLGDLDFLILAELWDAPQKPGAKKPRGAASTASTRPSRPVPGRQGRRKHGN